MAQGSCLRLKIQKITELRNIQQVIRFVISQMDNEVNGFQSRIPPFPGRTQFEEATLEDPQYDISIEEYARDYPEYYEIVEKCRQEQTLANAQPARPVAIVTPPHVVQLSGDEMEKIQKTQELTANRF